MFSFEICKFFKNTYLKVHLQAASICFTWKYLQQIVVASLDETLAECKVSIFWNVTISFNQMQSYNLYVS